MIRTFLESMDGSTALVILTVIFAVMFIGFTCAHVCSYRKGRRDGRW